MNLGQLTDIIIYISHFYILPLGKVSPGTRYLGGGDKINRYTGIHVLLVLGGLRLPKNSASKLIDRLDMTFIMLSGA